jgi:hypothetical protein
MKMEVSERILELYFLITLRPSHQRWIMVKFDGGQLTDTKSHLEISIRDCLISTRSSALMGDFQEIQTLNRQSTLLDRIYAFTRWSDTKNQLWSLIFRGLRLVTSNLKSLQML